MGKVVLEGLQEDVPIATQIQIKSPKRIMAILKEGEDTDDIVQCKLYFRTSKLLCRTVVKCCNSDIVEILKLENNLRTPAKNVVMVNLFKYRGKKIISKM